MRSYVGQWITFKDSQDAKGVVIPFLNIPKQVDKLLYLFPPVGNSSAGTINLMASQ